MPERQPIQSLLQPRLSHVLTHLQPNLAECILGTDPANLRLVHLSLRAASPLLIAGDPAFGTVDLALSLLVQLSAMNDHSHLRTVLLDPSGKLAQVLPQGRAPVPALEDMLSALSEADNGTEGARGPGADSPLVLVLVSELPALRSDPDAWEVFCSLIERGPGRGFAIIVLTPVAYTEIASLCRFWIAFASEWPDPTWPGGIFEEQAFRRLQSARQRGQFLVASAVAGWRSRQLVLPLIDLPARHAGDLKGNDALQTFPAPIACASLEVLLRNEPGNQPVQIFEALAAHVQTCSRCRHGFLKCSEPYPGIASLSCHTCCDLLPVYYEATHPDYALTSMPAAALVQVAWHLGQCLACGEVWASLLQLSLLEEEEHL